MVLTNKQEQGLKIALSRYNFGLPYTVISGYANNFYPDIFFGQNQ